MICINYFLLTTCRIVCLIMLCMLNQLSYLKHDWINLGATRKYFMTIMPNFKELEAKV